MTKIAVVEVEICQDCPYFNEDKHFHEFGKPPRAVKKEMFSTETCLKMNKKIEDTDVDILKDINIPKWCPLPNKGKKK